MNHDNLMLHARRVFPVLLFFLIAVGLYDPTFQQTMEIDEPWEAGCIAIAGLGLALRLFAAGSQPSRRTDAPRMHPAMCLPMLPGNALVWFGLALFPRSWPTALACGAVGVLICGRLLARLPLAPGDGTGQARRRWFPPCGAFSWRAALLHEGGPIFGTMLAFALLEVAGDLIIGEPFHVDPAWMLLVAVASLPWVGSRFASLAHAHAPAPAWATRAPSAATPCWWESPLALLLAGVFLLVWDASGADMAMAHLAGDHNGFPWRESWLATSVLHDGLRAVAWGGVAWVMLALAWPTGLLRSLTRAERVWLLGTLVLSTLLVSAMKHWSLTSCPWDLAEFGGIAQHVSHWHWGMADGGAGHCFPGGHASGGFAFIAGAFALQRARPRAAHAWVAGALMLGLTMGLAQQWRGAHFMSHTLWSAWLCWGCAQLSAAAFLEPMRRRTSRC
jgi:membrane-associated PAP2 superfamily phosphatase